MLGNYIKSLVFTTNITFETCRTTINISFHVLLSDRTKMCFFNCIFSTINILKKLKNFIIFFNDCDFIISLKPILVVQNVTIIS